MESRGVTLTFRILLYEFPVGAFRCKDSRILVKSLSLSYALSVPLYLHGLLSVFPLLVCAHSNLLRVRVTLLTRSIPRPDVIGTYEGEWHGNTVEYQAGTV